MSGSTTRVPAWTWLLVAEEAVVTAGGQFREVALPLLMVALWPSARSYALAQGLVLLPQVLLAGLFGRLADRAPARGVLVASYLVRAGALAVLIGAGTLPVALAALVALALGTGAYTPAMAHYQAGDGAGQAAALLGRLRMAAALARAVLPLLAGVAMAAGGRSLGFAVSLGAYLLATAVMLGLPALPAAAAPRREPRPKRRERLPRPIGRQVLVVTAVNAFGWIANMLYVGYLLVDLRVGAARYGLALGLWGGAGLVSGWLLGRVRMAALERLAAPCLLAMAVCWALMTRPLGYRAVALLGLPEGFVTWLLFDLLRARVLDLAPAARRGAWTAVAASWGAGGRLAGLCAVLVLPVFTHVHVGFGLVAALMAAAAIAVGASAGVSPGAAARKADPSAGVADLRPNESG